jgi:iron complex transport system permease protein
VTLTHAPAATEAARTVAGRRARRRRWWTAVGILLALVAGVCLLTLCVGDRTYAPGEVLRVLAGEQLPGVSFVVERLRLPRLLTGLLAGTAFGIGGVVFQTMLRNPLASPDIIGVTSGASAAAVVAITLLAMDSLAVSVLAVASGLLVAVAIYALSWRRGVQGARLVLVGIGIGAMLDSVVGYALTRASEYDVQEAVRWLTGSLNSAFWDGLPLFAAILAVLVPWTLLLSRKLTVLQLGDDASAALGERPDRGRLWLIVAAVGLVSVTTAVTGPIAFVAFLSGPIAHRLVRGSGPLAVPAALVGALLVVAADFAGAQLLGARLPVGIVTGAVGAPYLLWLLARTNRSGGSL